MTRQVLSDKEKDAEFKRSGLVKVRVFDRVDAEECAEHFFEMSREVQSAGAYLESPYTLSFFSEQSAIREAVFRKGLELLMPRLSELLVDYEPLIVNVFDKKPGGGEVPMHQNWTFVDERKHASISVWMPMLDVTRVNGALEVVPGTHKVICEHRAPMMPFTFNGIISVLKSKYCEPLDSTLGEAWILDDGVIHYSSPNEGPRSRVACQVIMTPREVTPALEYWHQDAPDDIEQFKVAPDFFFSYQAPARPSGLEFLGAVKQKLVPLTEADLVERVASHYPEIRERAAAAMR